MTTKICTKCKEKKALEEFYKRSDTKNGHRAECKVCIAEKGKVYFSKNREKSLARSKKYGELNREKISINKKKYHISHREEKTTYQRKYYTLNKKRLLANNKEWDKENKKKRNSINRKAEIKRLKNDPIFRLTKKLRRRLQKALKGEDKSAPTMELIGCSIEQLVFHIESQFTEGMSWEKMGNYGIHIDHTRPCASFDLSIPEQQRQCFNYKNLQPLWAEDNLLKSDTWYNNTNVKIPDCNEV